MLVNLSTIFQKLLNFHDLSLQEMTIVFGKIIHLEYTPVQISGLLIAFQMKGISQDELTAAVQVLRSKMIKVPLNKPYLIDTCGTGGDDSNSFNISTASAIVCAASGACVAKHGNKGVSSSCGSANVLEELGVLLETPLPRMQECLHTENIGFLYARHYHPVMKSVASIRQELAQRTIFNLLGPLLNPVQVKRQVIGVFDIKLLSLFSQTLSNLEMEHVMVVHGYGGVDEISLTGPSKYMEVKQGVISSESTFNPVDYGFSLCSLKDLEGGSVVENAQIIRNILANHRGPKRDVIILNAGFGLLVSGLVKTLQEGFSLATQTIESGKAKEKLSSWVNFLGH